MDLWAGVPYSVPISIIIYNGRYVYVRLVYIYMLAMNLTIDLTRSISPRGNMNKSSVQLLAGQSLLNCVVVWRGSIVCPD